MILCVMQFPPSAESHGGSQRAWYLVNALARIAPVHFVLIHPTSYSHAALVDMTPLRAVVASVTVIAVPEWNGTSQIIKAIPKRISRWIDLVRIRSIYTPHFSRQTLATIAAQLPVRDVKIVFAGRLPTATILDDLIDAGLLHTETKLVDFDDVQSSFQTRELETEKRRSFRWERVLRKRVLLRMIEAEEARVARAWDAVSVCSDEDVAMLARDIASGTIVKIPNVVDRPLLPSAADDPFTVLFVGNLSFGPNVKGLDTFLKEAWPLIKEARPSVRLLVVGLYISTSIEAQLTDLGIEFHSNVPSVTPYYERANAVIAPIFFGGGTRVKIVEAMAYGRPVVSTTIGVEGLDIEPGRHALVSDDMSEFAGSVISLATSPELCAHIAREARALQQARFSRPAMEKSVHAMVDAARTSAMLAATTDVGPNRQR